MPQDAYKAVTNPMDQTFCARMRDVLITKYVWYESRTHERWEVQSYDCIVYVLPYDLFCYCVMFYILLCGITYYFTVLRITFGVTYVTVLRLGENTGNVR